jgi:hypothetical protein
VVVKADSEMLFSALNLLKNKTFVDNFEDPPSQRCCSNENPRCE